MIKQKFGHIYDEKLFLILVKMKQIKEDLKCYTQLHFKWRENRFKFFAFY